MAQLIPYALLAVGTAMAYGQYKQGQHQASALRQSADADRAAAGAAAATQRIKGRLATGEAAAKYGASGLSFEGTPIDALAQSAMFAELDAQNILYKGEVSAYEKEAKARQVKSSANIGAATTLLTSLATFGTSGGMGSFGGFGGSAGVYGTGVGETVGTAYKGASGSYMKIAGYGGI